MLRCEPSKQLKCFLQLLIDTTHAIHALNGINVCHSQYEINERVEIYQAGQTVHTANKLPSTAHK